MKRKISDTIVGVLGVLVGMAVIACVLFLPWSPHATKHPRCYIVALDVDHDTGMLDAAAGGPFDYRDGAIITMGGDTIGYAATEDGIVYNSRECARRLPTHVVDNPT